MQILEENYSSLNNNKYGRDSVLGRKMRHKIVPRMKRNDNGMTARVKELIVHKRETLNRKCGTTTEAALYKHALTVRYLNLDYA